MTRIPYAQAVVGEEEIAAVTAALQRGWLGEGPDVAALEAWFVAHTGQRAAVACNSGSSANLLVAALLAARHPWRRRLEGRGTIITPACTFNTTVAPFLQHGFTVQLIDVDPGRYVATAARVAAAIDHATIGVVIPHLIGNCAEASAIRALCDARGLWLVEDCCDTVGSLHQGRPVGSYGHFATFSFYASHHVTGAGGGGLVATASEDDAEVIKQIRDWGRGDVYRTNEHAEAEDWERRFRVLLDGIPYDRKFFYEHLGYNLKMVEVQAAFLRVQLARLDAITARRRAVFGRLRARLEHLTERLTLPVEAEGDVPSWLAFPLSLRRGAWGTRRDALIHLEASGIQTRMIFAGNIARHPAYRGRVNGGADCPGADEIAAQGFLVGAHQHLTDRQVEQLATRLVEVICP